MPEPLDYQSPMPRSDGRGLRTTIAALMLVVGVGLLLLGTLLATIALLNFHGQHTSADPNWGWGPNAYVFHMMQSAAYNAIWMTPAGVATLFASRRMLRRRRG